MSDLGNNISDLGISELLPRFRAEWLEGAETVVLPPSGNLAVPMPATAICCLLPYRDIPFSGYDVRLNDEMHHIAPGECLVVPEGSRHRFYRTSDVTHRSIWVLLRLRMEPDLPLLDFFDVPAVIRGAAAMRCRQLMNKLNRGYCTRSLGRKTFEVLSPRRPGDLAEQLEDRALALLLLKELLAVSTPKETLFFAMSGLSELEDALQWIQRHKFSKITTAQLAKCCHCSSSTFEKKFRRIFGTPPGKYLLNLRLSAAEVMLRNTNESCAKIAESCGFANQFIFSRHFSRRYSMPPRKYRNWKTIG